MADTEVTEQPPQRSGALRGLIICAVVAIAAGVGGFAVPLLFPTLVGGGPVEPVAETSPLPAFVPFGETVVNLDEGRLNRYLRVSITLQVDHDQAEDITQGVEKNRAIMKSWLLSYLSDKGMDDIRGAAGQNRLRREIQDQFNSVLSPEGYERVHDVLFEEFNIQ